MANDKTLRVPLGVEVQSDMTELFSWVTSDNQRWIIVSYFCVRAATDHAQTL